MPAARDLTGERYGRLVVLSDTGLRTAGAIKRRIWLCRCACGRTEKLDQLLLPYNASQKKRRGIRYACSVCMRGPCVICESDIENDTYRGVCSEACYHERRKISFRDYYYRAVAIDPGFNRARYTSKREALLADSVKHEQSLAQERAAKQRHRANNRDRINANARARYHENREAVLRRRGYLREMDRDLVNARNRKYYAENAEHILALRANKFNALSDFEQKKLRDQRNIAGRDKYRAQKSEQLLNELGSIGATLKRIDNES